MCNTYLIQWLRQKGFGSEWSVCREGYGCCVLPVFLAEEAGRSVVGLWEGESLIVKAVFDVSEVYLLEGIHMPVIVKGQ